MVDYKAAYIDALNYWEGKEVEKEEILERDTLGNPTRTRKKKEVLFTGKITKTTSKGQVQAKWAKLRTYLESSFFPVKIKPKILAGVKKDLKAELGRDPTEDEIRLAFQVAWDDVDMDKRHPIFRQYQEIFKTCSDAAIYLTGGERDVYLDNYKRQWTCAFCYKDFNFFYKPTQKGGGYFTYFCSDKCLNDHWNELKKKYKAIGCPICAKKIDVPRKFRITDQPTCSWECLYKKLQNEGKREGADFKKCAECPMIQVYLMKHWGEELERNWVQKGGLWYHSILEYGTKRIRELRTEIEKLPGWKTLNYAGQNNFFVDNVNILAPGAEKTQPDGTKYTPPRYHYKPATDNWEISNEKWNEIIRKSKQLIKDSGHIPTFDEEKQSCIETLELLSGWNLLDNVTQKTLIQKARNATKSDDFKEIIIEARNKITAKRTGTSSSGGGGGGGSDPNIAARQDALNRIKVVLQGAKSGYFTNINNILNGIKGELETKTGTEITDHEKHWLDRIYRTIARKDLEKEAVDRSASVTDYGVGDLKTHLQGFSGQANIENEKNRLIDILKNKKTDRLTEVETAITEIKQTITNAKMNSKTEKAKLGDNWEAEFKNDYRHKESSEITTRKNQLLDIINRFVTENLAACQIIFESLEKSLRESGLNESILGTNWKNNFHGKNEDEREAERNRLVKLIEKAIEAKNISEQQKEEEKKKLAQESAQAVKTAVKTKLTQSHPKLVVKESEIPSEILAPYKTIEEKLAHCTSVEEVEQTETKILTAITQQRTNKLNTIRSTSINVIKKAVQGVNIQWGTNKDFEKSIQGMVDPDEIEKKEKYLLKIVEEQKAAQQKDGFKDKGNKIIAPPAKWPKVLGITALILIPVIGVGLVAMRYLRMKKRRRGEV